MCLCHADVALIICRNKRYYIYWLIDYKQWSLSITEIICINCDHQSWANSSLKDIIFTAYQSAD